jgi:hypothetical protein
MMDLKHTLLTKEKKKGKIILIHKAKDRKRRTD